MLTKDELPASVLEKLALEVIQLKSQLRAKAAQANSFQRWSSGPDDCGIVIERARIGFFMGWPSVRDKKKEVLDRCLFCQ